MAPQLFIGVYLVQQKQCSVSKKKLLHTNYTVFKFIFLCKLSVNSAVEKKMHMSAIIWYKNGSKALQARPQSLSLSSHSFLAAASSLALS